MNKRKEKKCDHFNGFYILYFLSTNHVGRCLWCLHTHFNLLPEIDSQLQRNTQAKAQLKLYQDVLVWYNDAIEIRQHQQKPAQLLDDLDLIVSEVNEHNRKWVGIPKIKFLVKFDAGAFNAALDMIYETEILIASDFHTAFNYALNKWQSLFLGLNFTIFSVNN
ncbi:hypothetical protein [Pedobacter gandavensis]|uniref:hypothetical protein n=1 Tax=Pedobacter gandavensis TaxID=2679963 RepID=UPI00292DAE91|nr:hypothetical protein [Pedobacter gandavensis]